MLGHVSNKQGAAHTLLRTEHLHHHLELLIGSEGLLSTGRLSWTPASLPAGFGGMGGTDAVHVPYSRYGSVVRRQVEKLKKSLPPCACC